VTLYLGSRLQIPSASITYRDVEPLLSRAGVKKQALIDLKSVFDECEASRYAGRTVTSEEFFRLQNLARSMAEDIERSMRR